MTNKEARDILRNTEWLGYGGQDKVEESVDMAVNALDAPETYIVAEKADPDFESCHDCIHHADSEPICILRKCIHAVGEFKECYVPKERKEGE